MQEHVPFRPDEWADTTFGSLVDSAKRVEREVTQRIQSRLKVMDHPVVSAVSNLYHEWSDEARSHAETRLYDLNSRGVEWFGGRAGWVFLFDELRGILTSVERAAYNTGKCKLELSTDGPGIVPHVFRTREGFWANDVSMVPFYQREIESTKSELAVPVFAPNGTTLGVYNIEADHVGAFTSAQVRELQKRVAYLVPHLLVLKQLLQSKDFGDLPWHPEIHSDHFTPRKLLEKYCRTIAHTLAIEDTPPPTCAIWNVDRDFERCWTLAAVGYDRDFEALETLPMNSAVARVATDPAGKIQSGSPESLGFVELQKAQRMALNHAIIAPISPSKTLNLYFFDERQLNTYPPDEVVRWLARRAGDLLESFYESRNEFALSYMYRELEKSPYASRELSALLTSLLHCTNAAVGSVFARELDSPCLRCVATTGLEREADFSRVKYHLVRDKKSYTGWLGNHPAKVLRLNWGYLDEKHLPPDLPKQPSGKSRESMIANATYHRRLLGLGLESENHELLGAIRILRSALAPPFTQEDEALLFSLCAAVRPIFVNWNFTETGKLIPTNLCSTQTRINSEFLPAILNQFRGTRAIAQATVFVKYERADPDYREYAYFSKERHLPPRNLRLSDLTRDLVHRRPTAISLVHQEDLDGASLSRLCVPVTVWSGPNLVESVLALDYHGDAHQWAEHEIAEVFDQAVRLAAIWAWNNMRPDRNFVNAGDDQLLRRFLEYVDSDASTEIAAAHLALYSDDEHVAISVGSRPTQSTFGPCADIQLTRFGVQISRDATSCCIPLMLGPIQAGVLHCALKPELAHLIASVLTGSTLAPLLAEQAYGRLRRVVASVCGTWSRLVAANLSFWNVAVSREVEDGVTLWLPSVGVCSKSNVVMENV